MTQFAAREQPGVRAAVADEIREHRGVGRQLLLNLLQRLRKRGFAWRRRHHCAGDWHRVARASPRSSAAAPAFLPRRRPAAACAIRGAAVARSGVARSSSSRGSARVWRPIAPCGKFVGERSCANFFGACGTRATRRRIVGGGQIRGDARLVGRVTRRQETRAPFGIRGLHADPADDRYRFVGCRGGARARRACRAAPATARCWYRCD